MFHVDMSPYPGIEKLEDGVYLERLSPSFSGEIVEESAPLVFGGLPDKWHSADGTEPGVRVLLRNVIEQLTEAKPSEWELGEDMVKQGCNPEAGCSLEEVKQILNGHGLSVEEAADLSLRELMELIDGESTVLCRANTWLLEPDTASLSAWVVPNDLVVLHMIDFRDPSAITVQYSSAETGKAAQSCDWNQFQLAWECGGREALIVDRNELI